MTRQEPTSLKRTRSHSSASSLPSESSQPSKAVKVQPHSTVSVHSKQTIESDEDDCSDSESSSEIEGSDDDQDSDGERESSVQVDESEPRQPPVKLSAPPLEDQDDDDPSQESVNLGSSPVESNHPSRSEASGTKPMVYSNGDWKAVYDPHSNAYYFANSRTGETTWTNPMIPSQSSSEPVPRRSEPLTDLGGIDPELAHLDPHMARRIHGHTSLNEPRFTARFNARTGRFEGDPQHDPSRVSEFARARTQAEAYFDVTGWEKSLERHNGRIPGTSKETRAVALSQGKKLSKAELNHFKQLKMEKKARNQRAWLVGSK